MNIQHIHGVPPLYTNTFLIITNAKHGILIKDAEAHAEEDRKRREAVDMRNEGDALVFRTEKLLAEHAETIGEDVKAPVVEATEAGKAWDATGVVAFSASWRGADGDSGVLRERSRFALADGRWLYVDGTHS